MESTSLVIIAAFLVCHSFPASAEASKDVFVTLTRTATSAEDLPTNTEVITEDSFNRWSPQSAGEAVRRMTSVQILPVGGLGATQPVQIRGANANETLVLVDGRPMGGIGFAGSQDLTEYPVENVDRIEVVRGGVSALYGPNAM